ncbi:MAG: hypothetical protein IKN43_02735 [Selenomonadaceae bacterium]|nr:hypothetical protein [Selenomonadaceae bacterium]
MDNKKKFTLMNKNTPVLDLIFSFRRGGYIEDVLKLHNPEYAPIGVLDEANHVDADDLSDWWEDRALPDTRSNVLQILDEYNVKKPELMVRSLGLSLSDQYWLRPLTYPELCWKDINFFTNTFSDEIGKMFFHGRSLKDGNSLLNAYSPEYSNNGFLKKYWTIVEGERILVKGSFGAFGQQAYNEVIASRILKALSCDNYVTYELEDENSLCKNFITEDTEFVSASMIRRILPKKDRETYYAHFMRCCERFGLESNMQKFLDYVIPFDYLIANEDRNFGNFGVIRNVETLKITDIAPIFDNGNSFWYDLAVITNDGLRSNPFELKQEEQIKLVKDASIFPIDKIGDVTQIICDVLTQNKNCNGARVSKIINAFEMRKSMLEQKFLACKF